MKKLVMDPVTRIEGHAKITIHVDDAGQVSGAQFHVDFRCEALKSSPRAVRLEMPSIARAHLRHLPYQSPARLRESLRRDHVCPDPRGACKLYAAAGTAAPGPAGRCACSFFHLSAPDLLLGMDCDPARRNILGIVEKHPEIARDGIALRKFGQQIIEGLAGERIHPSWIVPGGVNAPLSSAVRDRILAGLPEAKIITRRALDLLKGVLEQFADEVESFGNAPTMYAGMVDEKGLLQLYDGRLRFHDGDIVADQIAARNYSQFIGEAAVPDSFLKAPYFKPAGYPEGIYRVGPLARLNVAARCGTPEADIELTEFRQRCGPVAQSSFYFHYARLVEIVYGLERIAQLLDDRSILDTNVRARASVNSLEGVGMAEAPRGVLIHHYKVNSDGAIRWANLIVATGHNDLAIGRSVTHSSKAFHRRHASHRRHAESGLGRCPRL